MQGTISVGGLASGLNVDDIIQKLGQLERGTIQRYREQQDTLRSRLSAFQEANTRLAAIRDAAGQLAGSTFFQNRAVASSKTDLLTAGVEIGATTGEYQVSVERLARAHQVMSESYSSLDAPITQGTLQITSGGKTTTVTVDGSNNSLRALKDSINNAGGNVRAAIIQDGDSSYRLMLSSKETGTANAITLTNNLAASSGSVARPDFIDLQTAQDSQVKLGSGASAITVTRSSNAVQDLIPGVTLNLVSAQPGASITVTVSQDKSKIQDGVQKLVDQYNNAVDYVNKQFHFDGDTKEGGTLLGDFTLKNAQNDLNRVFSGIVAGLGGNTKGLADVGINFDSSGKLVLNASQLQDKLASDPDSVMNVFALGSQSTNAGVSLVAVGQQTVVDGTAFAVQVTQAARAARVTAGAAQTGALGAAETLTVNGVSIALTAGMTQAQLLDAINSHAKETGVKASATAADGTGSGNFLTLTATGVGSGTAVSVISSRSNSAAEQTLNGTASGIGNGAATAASPGGEGGAGTGVTGLDVAGTINGEAATGKGDLLTGNAGNARTDGLQLRVSTTSPGAAGSITLFDGLANAAQRTLTGMLDPKSGAVQGEEDNLQSRIDYLQQIMDEREEAAKRNEDTLRDKFNALEATMSDLQSQSTYLTTQLASLR